MECYFGTAVERINGNLKSYIDVFYVYIIIIIITIIAIAITITIIIIISVLCPRAGPSLQTQGPRLQFCPKTGLPP